MALIDTSTLVATALAPLLPQFSQNPSMTWHDTCRNPLRISRKGTLGLDVGFGTVHFWELRIAVSVPKQAGMREEVE
jgi:hypothetical protein